MNKRVRKSTCSACTSTHQHLPKIAGIHRRLAPDRNDFEAVRSIQRSWMMTERSPESSSASVLSLSVTQLATA